jgi:hypothetical protein
MATAKVIDEKRYLLEAYRELHGMIERINALRRDLSATYGGEGVVFKAHDRHLLEMADYIGWKLMILEKGTGFDWKEAGEKDIESIVSVSPADTLGPDFSGGYVGG